MNKKLYRVEEAAQLLGVGRTRVFDLIKLGELRSVKIGCSRRIPAAALDEYIERLLASAS
ncbi:MAG: helix-turn-helix domain-containing protein [Pseudonocardiaceae bacterium]|nr:helix-turn-helix domain-containing protein [Pseudonocardiaceae bacterium]